MKFIKRPLFFVKRHKWLSLGILLAVLVIAFMLRPKPAPLITTQKVEPQDLIQSVSVSGSVVAKNEADLSFTAAATLVYIGARKGDMVKSGQILASEDERTIEKNLQSAVDAYKNQKITFDTTNDKNGNRPLTDTGLSTSALRELETAVNSLDEAQLAVDIQQIAKEQANLVSPIAGILTSPDGLAVGSTAKTTTTFSVVDPSSLVFSMDVDEADIGKVKKGQQVKINFDAYPDETLTFPVENIDFVSHTGTNGGNVFSVEAKLPSDANYKYRVGMNGNAEIITAEHKNVLTVPISSLVDDHYVYIKTAKGFIKKSISLGLQNDTDTEVINGLSKGDIVATQPSEIPASKM